MVPSSDDSCTAAGACTRTQALVILILAALSASASASAPTPRFPILDALLSRAIDALRLTSGELPGRSQGPSEAAALSQSQPARGRKHWRHLPWTYPGAKDPLGPRGSQGPGCRSGCFGEEPAPTPVVEAASGAVASDEGRCSAVGRDILKELGGNAVDAAVATVFCAGVLNPVASGLGGGAFMLIRLANGSAEFIDSRETAPLAASQDMYAGRETAIGRGPLSVAVPGELRGLYTAWQRHGSLPWASLVAPSVALAAQGFEVSPYLAGFIQSSAAVILDDPGLRSVFAPRGQLLRAGDTCVRAELARTLSRIAEEGPGVLYGGQVGLRLVQEVQAAGGILTLEDLRLYTADVTPAVTVEDVFGLTAITVPPPSGGGVAVIEILKILEGFKLPLASIGPLGVHRTVEAMKHAFAMRMELGDPNFVAVNKTVHDMLSEDFAARLRRSISDDVTFSPSHYGRAAAEGGAHPLYKQTEDHGTSHTCIIDRHRNAVSVTSTVNGPWGAGILSPSTGILLNNEMADFSIPSPNRSAFAPPPAPSNFIRPGKRPLSSMAPLVLLQKGKLRAVLGGSGGTLIISAVVQVFLNYFVKGMSPMEAVRAPRVHHQLLPDLLIYEANHTVIHGVPISLDETTIAALRRRGHTLFPLAFAGVTQLILHDLERPVTRGEEALEKTRNILKRARKEHNEGLHAALRADFDSEPRSKIPQNEVTDLYRGVLTAVSDPRKDGVPAGY